MSENKDLNKAARVKFILQKLQSLYPEPPIPLNHKDAYTLLIAVLLSAQCTDERVNTVTPALFALADNPFDMAKIPVEKNSGNYSALRFITTKIQSDFSLIANAGQ